MMDISPAFMSLSMDTEVFPSPSQDLTVKKSPMAQVIGLFSVCFFLRRCVFFFLYTFTISVIIDPPAVIGTESNPEDATVVPVHMDCSYVVDSDHGSERTDGWSLRVVHQDKLHPAAPGESIPQAF